MPSASSSCVTVTPPAASRASPFTTMEIVSFIPLTRNLLAWDAIEIANALSLRRAQLRSPASRPLRLVPAFQTGESPHHHSRSAPRTPPDSLPLRLWPSLAHSPAVSPRDLSPSNQTL